jgi:drug/metabolite transporter (DMT)-like permease
VQLVALGLMAAVVAVASAAVLLARRQSSGLIGAPAPRAASPVLAGFVAAVVTLAIVLELWGLWVSLRAYGDRPPPALHVLVVAAVVLLCGIVAYFVYLWTQRQFALRRRR